MIKKGLAVAVILLFIGVAVAPNINADVSKQDIEVLEEDVTPTPIVLAFQLITKLRNHKDIQNVETEDDVLQIIEGDEELNSIYEQLTSNDCGCEDDTPELERIWPFPFICIFIGVPFFMLGLLIAMTTGDGSIGEAAGFFGYMFNCFWH